MKPTPTANELREHFLEQIANKERLTFISKDVDKIIMKAKQKVKL